MATHVGILLISPERTEQYANADWATLTDKDYPLTWRAAEPLQGSTHIEEAQEAQPADVQVGNVQKSFGFLNWYDHYHVEPLSIDLGNLISVQQREVKAFNGFFVSKTLADVIPANDDGLTLTEPASTPLLFAPLQEFTYELSITTDGPPLVDATYTFDFSEQEFVVHVVGVRIVAWQWEANWLTAPLERLAFNTDIITSYDGSEQRRALREAPRCEFEFTFDVTDGLRRLFENVLYSWGARIWALPIWSDIEPLADLLVTGSTFIPIEETSGRDWHADGLGLILGADGTYESFEVLTVEANGVNLKNPTVGSWPLGSRVYPARTARLMDPRATQRWHRNFARGLARFRTVEEIERTALTETLYRGEPVMEREPNWRDAPEIDYARKLVAMDFGYGKDDYTDQSKLAIPVHSYRWTMLDREEINYFREWVYARSGRCKGIWLPTWSDDLVLAGGVLESQLNIDVEQCGLTYFAQADVHRRDIRIQLTDGTVFYRRVSAFTLVDANTERMTLNAPLGQIIFQNDVERISWLHYVRLDTDSIELTWLTPAQAEAVIVLRGPRNEF